MMTHACTLGAQKAEAGGLLQGQGQPRLHSKFQMSQ